MPSTNSLRDELARSLPAEVTGLLVAWNEGNTDALAELMPCVCDDLRQMARRYLRRERANHTLQPTALVHEFFLRIQGRRTVNWRNRAHFFGFAAQTMRRILVDYARRRNRLRHGSGKAPLSLERELEEMLSLEPSLEIVALHDALKRLEAKDSRIADVVKLRFFVGMTVEETAAALEVSVATVKRDWQFARMWLFRELKSPTDPQPH